MNRCDRCHRCLSCSPHRLDCQEDTLKARIDGLSEYGYEIETKGLSAEKINEHRMELIVENIELRHKVEALEHMVELLND